MSTRVFDTLSPLRGLADKLEFHYAGVALSDDDSDLIRDCLALWGALALDLLGKAGLNTYVWHLSQYTSFDCESFGQAIKEGVLALRHVTEFLDTTEKRSYAAFTQQLRRAHRSILFRPIEPYLLQYFQTTDPADFYICIQWVSFLSKVELRSVDRSNEIEDWVHFEAEARNWSYDPGIVAPLRDIITGWFSHYHCGQPRVTSGAKYEIQRRNVTLPGCVRELCFIPEHPEWPHRNDYPCDRQNRLEIVPKSMVSGRIVSPEPVTMGFYQKAVCDGMLRTSTGTFRRIVHLDDQERSRRLAQKGSINGDFATLDLSAASDSVTVKFVIELFRDCQALLIDLLGSRSLTTKLPDGRVIPLAKFAPMGSACCFPVECAVFAAVCESCRIACGSHRLSVVYGDDLVVPHEYADAVVELLEKLHFSVNIHKSYWKQVRPVFREACGGQYIDGNDVTPLMVSRKFGNHRRVDRDPSTFDSWKAMVDRSYDYYLPNLRSYLLRQLQLTLGWRFKDIDRQHDGYEQLYERAYPASPGPFCNTQWYRRVFGTFTEYATLCTSDDLRYDAWLIAATEDSLDWCVPATVRPDLDPFMAGARPQRKLRRGRLAIR